MTPNEIEWNCTECGNTDTVYTIKIIPTGRPAPFPKNSIQIKESCVQCGKYKRFAPQTGILIKRFNDRLSTLLLPSKGRDIYE